MIDYLLLELIKFSTICICRALPVSAKSFFMVSEGCKMLVITSLMFGMSYLQVQSLTEIPEALNQVEVQNVN